MANAETIRYQQVIENIERGEQSPHIFTVNVICLCLFFTSQSTILKSCWVLVFLG